MTTQYEVRDTGGYYPWAIVTVPHGCVVESYRHKCTAVRRFNFAYRTAEKPLDKPIQRQYIEDTETAGKNQADGRKVQAGH